MKYMIASIQNKFLSGKSLSRFLLLLIPPLIYLVLNLWMVTYHEPWRDEAEPWLIAQDAQGMEFFHATRYEEHPWLWYFLLRPLAQSGLPYVSQSIFHIILAFSAILIFWLRAPFHRIIKLGLMFSYYFMYQYSLIARHYVLGILCMFLAAWFYSTRHTQPLRYGCVLFLMFCSSFLCLPLGLGLVLLYAYELWSQQETRSKRNFISLTWMSLGLMGALYLVLNVPPDHRDFGGGIVTNYLAPLQFAANSLFPLGTDIGEPSAMIVGAFFLLFVAGSLIPDWKKLFLFCFSYLGFFSIFVFIRDGGHRHFGYSLIYALFFLWISQSPEQRSAPLTFLQKKIPYLRDFRTWAMLILISALFLSFKYSIFSYRLEYHMYFSGARPMAEILHEVIEKIPIDDLVIVAHPHEITVSVQPYFPQNKFWYPYLNDFASYYVNTKSFYQSRNQTGQEIVDASAQRWQSFQRLLFLTHQPLELTQDYGHDFRLLAKVDRGIYGYGKETFYLYKPLPKTPAS